MNRRSFIKTSGASLAAVLISPAILAATGKPGNLLNSPDAVSALVAGKSIALTSGDGKTWTNGGVGVFLSPKGANTKVSIQSATALSQITLSWKIPSKTSSHILNDHWERTYGDVSWHAPKSSDILPWYFLENNNGLTSGFGVKTGASAFCFWTIQDGQLSLTLDTRSGTQGVALGDRILHAAEIVTMSSLGGETPFKAGQRFMRLLCDKARMPKAPVYGINDWYFSYGDTSEKLILQHTELMAPLTEGLSNRPFSVIDAGWFKGNPAQIDDCCWGDDMKNPEEKFPDMAKLADKIKKLDMRPGIWTRPLCGSYKDPKSLLLPNAPGRDNPNKPVLDPTIPDVLERVKEYFKLYNQWGYEMVKFDFTSDDIFGKWGFEMLRDNRMADGDWRMYDNSKTNAEIVHNLYKTIRAAAGETYIIGCNTISHLSAGLFELNRIGDDTSGLKWETTLKMGVNTLAFRGIQHGTFYAADADCVGLTTKVPWEKNKQWMELLARSGTPIFISAQPDATGAEQKAFIKQCFEIASKPQELCEPLDWLATPTPSHWKLDGKKQSFDWS